MQGAQKFNMGKAPFGPRKGNGGPFKPGEINIRKMHNSCSKPHTEINEHSFPYNFDPRNSEKLSFLRFKYILMRFQAKNCKKILFYPMPFTFFFFKEKRCLGGDKKIDIRSRCRRLSSKFKLPDLKTF